MASLDPVMSSMDMLFHAFVPESSAVQPRVQGVPWLKESPGPGALGDTCAWDNRAALEARTAVKTMDVNIIMTF